ncbi:acyl-CoA dehydrogenase family protein [Acuticoccus kandeliae]|uniref:acyl-CoA dehydrogenase family protein n=1 Tax=Acuticoccus kandeliae TaxID=2073160 RepID=UPI000D3EA1A2|nr:acyl-CoA dehydrogenase [Acuticoccus kandeliae]
MNFEPTEERRLLADSLARFLADRHGPEAMAARLETGHDPAFWRALCDLGAIGALVPEEAGGFAGGGFDIATVFEALGHALVLEPALATGVLGARLAAAGGRGDLVEAAIAGEARLAFAHHEPQSRYDMAEIETRAVAAGDGWRIDGRKAVALGADQADTLFVSARVAGEAGDEDGLALFAIPADAPGLTRIAYPTVDGGGAADLVLSEVLVGADAVIGAPGDAYPLIEEVLGLGVLALSAEALGAMEAVKAMTLRYLAERHQFGRPIGAFQALQHRMVDMTIEIETVRSAVIRAASAVDGAARLPRELALSGAKNLVGRVGRMVAEEAIQLHGAIGMTWEYPLGHYAKRLVMIDHQLGDTDFHLERYVALKRGG